MNRIKQILHLAISRLPVWAKRLLYPENIWYGGSLSRKTALESVGAGWARIINNLYDIKPRGVRVTTVKEKFGTLRFYIQGVIPEWYKTLVAGYEIMSGTVCEDCGDKGSLVDNHGWLRTLCGKCRAKMDFERIVSDPIGTVYHDKIINGYRNVVVRGRHSLVAYVGVNSTHPLFRHDTSYIKNLVECHGGFTYSGFRAWGEHGVPDYSYWYFGWDYSHINMEDVLLSEPQSLGVVHTTYDVIDECELVSEKIRLLSESYQSTGRKF